MEEQQQQPQRPVPPSFLDRLTDQIEAGANTKAVFGNPIERDGTTVIPVARARWGVGGGAAPREGIGGGGGATITPIGFIEVSDGCAEFKPIRNPLMAPLLAIGTGVFALSAFRLVVQLLQKREIRGRRGRRGLFG